MFSERTNDDIDSRVDANRPLRNGILEALSPWQKSSFFLLSHFSHPWPSAPKVYMEASHSSPRHCVKLCPDQFRIANVIHDKPILAHHNVMMQKLRLTGFCTQSILLTNHIYLLRVITLSSTRYTLKISVNISNRVTWFIIITTTSYWANYNNNADHMTTIVT